MAKKQQKQTVFFGVEPMRFNDVKKPENLTVIPSVRGNERTIARKLALKEERKSIKHIACCVVPPVVEIDPWQEELKRLGF